VPGVRVVVDLGLDRESVYYPDNKITRMEEVTISKASAWQRAGRTGRTLHGICYRLYSKQEYSKMPEHKNPEIQRCCLDSLVLRLLDMGHQPTTFEFV
jgi:HrpA-like RNA helicase